METIGLKIPRIEIGDDLGGSILKSAGERGGLKDKDVIVVASSAVSTVQGRSKELENVEPLDRAGKLAREIGIDEKFVEVVLQESDGVLGIGEGCILTMNDGEFKINAGVDRTNAPPGQVLLMPKNPDRAAKDLRRELENKTGKRLGVVIADSHLQPFRLGTIGQAIGVSGINSAIDCRGKKDLYGRLLRITFRNIADQLASAAQIEMGESDESIPAVVVRGVDIAFSDGGKKSLKIPIERDVYSDFFNGK